MRSELPRACSSCKGPTAPKTLIEHHHQRHCAVNLLENGFLQYQLLKTIDCNTFKTPTTSRTNPPATMDAFMLYTLDLGMITARNSMCEREIG